MELTTNLKKKTYIDEITNKLKKKLSTI